MQNSEPTGSKQFHPSNLGSSKESLQAFVLLAVVTAVAHFSHAGSFGFYEDDWFILAPLVDQSFARFDQIYWALSNPNAYGGRPIGFIFARAFIASLQWFGDLRALFAGAALIVLVNSFLFYQILRRLIATRWALLGAVIMLLSPADTTRQFLVHTVFIQLALFFGLLQILIYQTRLRWLALIFLPPILLTYETAYLLLLATPFLTAWTNKARFLRDAALYFTAWVSIAASIYWLRSSAGEKRASLIADADPQVIWTIVQNWLQADATAAATFALWPIKMLANPNLEFWVVGLGVAIMIWFFSWRQPSTNSANQEHERANAILGLFAAVGIFIVGGLSAGLIAAAGSLPSLDDLSGRVTRFYLISGMGLALLIANIAHLVDAAESQSSISKTVKKVTQVVLLFLCSSYAATAVKVQHDYQLAWSETAELLNSIVKLVPDISAGDRIIVEGTWSNQSDFDGDQAAIRAYVGYTYALEGLFDLSDIELEQRPKIFLTSPKWVDALMPAQEMPGCLDWKSRVIPGDWRGKNLMCQHSTILLKKINGDLVRSDEPLVILQVDLAKANPTPPYARSELYLKERPTFDLID